MNKVILNQSLVDMKSNQSNEWYIFMKQSLEDMKSNRTNEEIETTFSEKYGRSPAVRLPPAKRNEWKWTVDV
jgi:hypothetical protein